MMPRMVQRIFVEKRSDLAQEAKHTLKELNARLNGAVIRALRLLHRYDAEGLTPDEFNLAAGSILSEAPSDILHIREPELTGEWTTIRVEPLPGQYDQRADSASQAIQLLTHGEAPAIACAQIWLIEGDLTSADRELIRRFLINPVENREASQELPSTLLSVQPEISRIQILDGFRKLTPAEQEELRRDYGLAMSAADLELCREYFAETEMRDPTETELRVLDTYWSDHCRHTTFLTTIEAVEFGEDPVSRRIHQSYAEYLEQKRTYSSQKPVTLMDLATIVMKQFRAEGVLDDLDQSEEINACSIRVEATVDGKREAWLLMFKNETHNHPTEIEPFGGAATCLGGAIRDPLSGRSYVYQAMRVTGAADPREKTASTLPGKLPQRTITTTAARGYSSYGNQIGIATGQVHEFYHPGYKAKRMEIGAVVGAVPEAAVDRKEPAPGDLVLLIGGRTGRDGIGGATGSSKEHDAESLESCGAEVQKGNPPTERKLQRLFRDRELSVRIKRCNDFGAGGVSVAVGELAPSIEIDLDAVPKKYSGLNGTEIAISESQERMALVIDREDLALFLAKAEAENLEATVIAEIADHGRLKMRWQGEEIVDLSRSFLDTNGAEQRIRIAVDGPDLQRSPFKAGRTSSASRRTDRWLSHLSTLQYGGQEGLGLIFDSTIGAASLLSPYGGETQTTPADGMAARLPVMPGSDTTTCSLMSFGFDPELSSWSPYHGAAFAVLESAAKIAAMGGEVARVRLSFQEYFERLGADPARWGKPLAALLGAFAAQQGLRIPAIGGKDSMSGSFEELDVPPTLVSFAVCAADEKHIVSQELKRSDSSLLLCRVPRDGTELPDFTAARRLYARIYELALDGKLRSAKAIGSGGAALTLSQMAFGNRIGVRIDEAIEPEELFLPDYGSLIIETDGAFDPETIFGELPVSPLGRTGESPRIDHRSMQLPLEAALKAWRTPQQGFFPLPDTDEQIAVPPSASPAPTSRQARTVPRVIIPVFPGTNCEYDSEAAFLKAGAAVESLVLRNLNPGMIEESIDAMAAALDRSQILMLPGGFSAGDEPEGSGKFIAAFFRNPRLTEAVHKLLDRDGLILGICNGFQALIKLGLLPYGRVSELTADSPTLSYNTSGAHVSRFVRTRIESDRSPWLARTAPGAVHRIPVSHGEGRFIATPEQLQELSDACQIAARYVEGENPNGSVGNVEALISPDGRILGKMGHSERIKPGLYRNIPGAKDQELFRAGVEYFL